MLYRFTKPLRNATVSDVVDLAGTGSSGFVVDSAVSAEQEGRFSWSDVRLPAKTVPCFVSLGRKSCDWCQVDGRKMSLWKSDATCVLESTSFFANENDRWRWHIDVLSQDTRDGLYKAVLPILLWAVAVKVLGGCISQATDMVDRSLMSR